MNNSFNTVRFIGTILNSPKESQFESGIRIDFTLKGKDKNETILPLFATGKQAEIAQKYFSIGYEVAIEGRIINTPQGLAVQVRDFSFLGTKTK